MSLHQNSHIITDASYNRISSDKFRFQRNHNAIKSDTIKIG